jgi:predicted dinucleotide-binding enzyme
MGSRSAENPDAQVWAKEAGDAASVGTFADAAQFGELIFNCTAGTASLAALGSAGPDALAGKVIIDVANPLQRDGSGVTLAVSNNDSLGEQIQRQFPAARVVKALNTMNNAVMVDPSRVPGSHNVFICGDDAQAKEQVLQLLQSFGWPAENILDLGGIVAARGPEMYLPLWLSLWRAMGSGDFNIHVVKG